MNKTIARAATAIALGLATMAAAASGPGFNERPRFGLNTYDYPVATSFDLDIVFKGPTDASLPTAFRSMWKQAVTTCDDRGGYIAIYHDGDRVSRMDTFEMSSRLEGYATCRLMAPAASTDAQEATLYPASLPTKPGVTQHFRVRGDFRKAYTLALDHALERCLAIDERVRHFSVARTPSDAIDARFACTSTEDGLSPLSKNHYRRQ